MRAFADSRYSGAQSAKRRIPSVYKLMSAQLPPKKRIPALLLTNLPSRPKMLGSAPARRSKRVMAGLLAVKAATVSGVFKWVTSSLCHSMVLSSQLSVSGVSGPVTSTLYRTRISTADHLR